MITPRPASFRLVLSAVLLFLLGGCGTATSTKGPQPVPSSPSAAVPVATSGLRLGYSWQPVTANLYPIVGVTGAAYYGNAVLGAGSNSVAAAAIVTPAGAWALVLRKDGVLQQWDLASVSGTTLAAEVPADSNILLSPSGNAAVLTSSTASTALIITGLPTKATVASVPLPSAFSSPDVAVSDSGTLVVGVTRSGSAGVEVGTLSANLAYAAFARVAVWGGAAFVPGTAADTAVIADATSVLLASHLSTGTASLASIPVVSGWKRAAGIAASADGKWAYVADSGNAQFLRISLAGSAAPSVIPCACTPQQLVPLTSDGIFSVTRNVAGQADWVLDTRTPQPRSVFIPANSSSSPGTISNSQAKQSDRNVQ